MRRTLVALSAAFVLFLTACTGGNAGGGATPATPAKPGTPTGHVDIVVWHGYTGAEATAMKKLVAQFNATHSNVTVTQEYYGNADYALQKVLTSIAGGKPPDLAYLYGSWAANIAKSPKTVALNGFISGDTSL